MREKIFFYITVVLLLVAGAWGIWLIDLASQTPNNDLDQAPILIDQSTSTIAPSRVATQQVKPNTRQSNTTLKKIKQLIATEQYRDAANHINTHYSALSSDELIQIKTAFLSQFSKHRQSKNHQYAQTLLVNATSALDDLALWKNLAAISIKLTDWPTALSAQLRSAELEIDPQQLDGILLSLVSTASQLRAKFEQLDDQLSIRELYQRLNAAHPSYARFQLELAQSHLRLDNPERALPLLEQLQYDPELGRLAKQKLAALKQDQERLNDQEEVATAQPQKNLGSDILVPLNRVGNSFLVNTSINGRSSPLLLDTGASITALSKDLIRRLNLEPTGRSIQLSTANGIARSNLYRAKRIRLGRLAVDNLIVAEIDLKRNSGFQGLLGTDLLNRINTNYSYLIDNQNNALIFRRH